MNYLINRTHKFPSLFDDVFFRDFFGDDFFSPLPSLKKIDYPVDIYEKDNELILEIAAVGLDKSDIKIDIKNDILEVSHINTEKVADKSKQAYVGITRKDFKLAWRINDRFDLTKTRAELDKGLLKISIPSVPKTKSNEFEVKIQ